MTEETNGAKEKDEAAQDERPNRRRQILVWAAALLGGLTFVLLGRYVGWTGFYAFAVSCILIPLSTAAFLHTYKMILRRWKWSLIAVGAATLGLLLGSGSFDWAVGWLRRYETETNLWTFCWRIALECFFVGLALQRLIAILSKKFKLGWTETKKHEDSPPSEVEETKLLEVALQIMTAPSAGEAWKLFSANILFGYMKSAVRSGIRPAIAETLVFQAIPIALLRLAGASFGTQVVVSMILFALGHFVESTQHGISAGIRGGFYFAFVYAHWRRVSFWRAFWMTSLVHGLNNTASSIFNFILMIVVLPIARIAVMKSGIYKRKELLKSVMKKSRPGMDKEEIQKIVNEEMADGASESAEEE